MQVIDTLLSLGPMRDIAIGDPISSASASLGVDNRRGPPQLVACSGQGNAGSLTVLRRTLVPELIVQVPLTGMLMPAVTTPPSSIHQDFSSQHTGIKRECVGKTPY